MAKAVIEVKDEPLEKQLWKAADKLRKNIDAAEYKHVVLGLIFLKYISDSFEEHFAKLQASLGEYAGADPEGKDEYKAENVFLVPPDTRWSFCSPKPNNRILASSLMPRWMSSKKRILRLKVFYPKSMPGLTSIPPAWAA